MKKLSEIKEERRIELEKAANAGFGCVNVGIIGTAKAMKERGNVNNGLSGYYIDYNDYGVGIYSIYQEHSSCIGTVKVPF